MKKFLIIVVVVLVGYLAADFFMIGPFAYDYGICENGYYRTYPRGWSDGPITYYDSSNNIAGISDGSLHVETQSEKELDKKTGKCTNINFLKFFFIKKLGL